MTVANPLYNDLLSQANPVKAISATRFFKTKPGEYGAGELFLGVPVPMTRRIVKAHQHAISVDDITHLMQSPYHEVRLAGLLGLIGLYESKTADHTNLYKLYLSLTARINNWDLVDVSAHKIVGPYLFHKTLSEQTQTFTHLMQSKELWERRIALVANLYFIKRGVFLHVFHLCLSALEDKEDLIHKAAGWMLKEVGKKDMAALETFLKTSHQAKGAPYFQIMPRTMLRFSIEKCSERKRKFYLNTPAIK
jgi:3-methyladenine DNA glycosylase AlkD